MPSLTKTELQDSGDGGGFSTWNCADPALPLLISIPHSGRLYPPSLADNLRIEPHDLQRLEDRYADRLAQRAIASGVPTLVAHVARAWIDLNRDERDIDPAIVEGGFDQSLGSAKMRGGLGLIPRRLAIAGELWKRPWPRADIDRRVATYHAPYHDTIDLILGAMRARFGHAILLDLHSMPPLGPVDSGEPQIVVGDLFGQSASSLHAELIIARLRAQGLRVALNNPYPGDYVLRRHGARKRNVHALQIEIDRSLYLDSDLREPSPAIDKFSRIICDIALMLVDQSHRSPVAIAAE